MGNRMAKKTTSLDETEKPECEIETTNVQSENLQEYALQSHCDTLKEFNFQLIKEFGFLLKAGNKEITKQTYEWFHKKHTTDEMEDDYRKLVDAFHKLNGELKSERLFYRNKDERKEKIIKYLNDGLQEMKEQQWESDRLVEQITEEKEEINRKYRVLKEKCKLEDQLKVCSPLFTNYYKKYEDWIAEIQQLKVSLQRRVEGQDQGDDSLAEFEAFFNEGSEKINQEIEDMKTTVKMEYLAKIDKIRNELINMGEDKDIKEKEYNKLKQEYKDKEIKWNIEREELEHHIKTLTSEKEDLAQKNNDLKKHELETTPMGNIPQIDLWEMKPFNIKRLENGTVIQIISKQKEDFILEECTLSAFCKGKPVTFNFNKGDELKGGSTIIIGTSNVPPDIDVDFHWTEVDDIDHADIVLKIKIPVAMRDIKFKE